ncbi:MAG TPA: FecR domain-containing protein [Puia sp.]|jgi:ferric-dicitrate binding protein FerR (iron transport regulator)|nr:FecR domain-containing protein [Puia sp.]
MDDLLIKYLLGEATGEEVAQVERWLEADAVNRVRLEQYKTLWTVGRRMAHKDSAGLGSGDTRKAWRQVQSTLGQATSAGIGRVERGGKDYGHPGGKLSQPVMGNGKGWLRLAAVVVGILLLGVSGYLMLMNRQPKGAPASVAGTVPPGAVRPGVVRSGGEVTPTVKTLPMIEANTKDQRDAKFWRGEKLVAGVRPGADTLPDGTIVTLNRGAALAYVRGSVGKGLTVRLQGEAFFSVTHDPARAFVVQAGTVTIKVLGTSFELNETGDSSIELAVETGAVRAGNSMIVHAGERLSITGRDDWKIGPNKDQLYGYYLGRPLVCDSVPLRRLVEVMNRSDDTPVILARKELGDLPLTTVFRGGSPERILDIVALTFNLSVVRQGQTIILR